VLAVAGTHGKTTITTMIAHLLRHSGYGCNAFLGGIAVNYDSNYWSHENNVCVVAADEYDRSFLRLSPDIAVITAMDADHLDIYGTKESMEEAFIEFTAGIKLTGMLVSKLGLKRGNELKGSKKLTYHQRDNSADAYAENISMHHGSYSFDIVIEKKKLSGFTLHMGGLHNIENIVAAVTVANQLGIDEEKIKAAVAAFKGVKRRFEYIVKEPGLVYIDDYAHHPTEIDAVHQAVAELYPDRKVLAIFQPHLFSRTRDFIDGFAKSLSAFENIVLLDIYPARELPIEGVTSKWLLDKIENPNQRLVSKADLLRLLKMTDADVIVTIGAGDIGEMVPDIKRLLYEKN